MTEPLIDGFGRRHNSLRLSVTDRCNIRCAYCMPEDVTFLPRPELLTFEEIVRFARVASELGVNKLRLTGGEPLVRRDVAHLVERLVALPGVTDVGLTTNGILLAEQGDALYRAGLRRLNISLDTLDRQQFQRITRRDAFDATIRGIEKAVAIGFPRIKINAVAIKGETDDQVAPLARFCRERGVEMRFIEFMPLDADGNWRRDGVLTADEILAILERAGLPARPLPPEDPSAPAEEYEYLDGGGRLGLIASVSKPFCGHCNRIRLTAEGKLRNCLFSLDETDIKGPLRSGAGDDEIARLIRESVQAKWAGHLINNAAFQRPVRTMHTIGG